MMAANLDQLEGFVREQLELHERIFKLVRPYVLARAREFGIDPESDDEHTRTTLYAMTMELARSIFVNWSVKQRYQKR